MIGFNVEGNMFHHALPHELPLWIARAGIDIMAIWKAFVTYGVPIVLAVLEAFVTQDWGKVIAIVGVDGWPLIQAIAAALGIKIPTDPPVVTP